MCWTPLYVANITGCKQEPKSQRTSQYDIIYICMHVLKVSIGSLNCTDEVGFFQRFTEEINVHLDRNCTIFATTVFFTYTKMY